MCFIFKNTFDGISNSLVETGKLDGCSNFDVFFRIMFPLSMLVIIFVSSDALSGSWSDFFGPLFYLDSNMTIPLKIYRMQNDSTIQMNTKFMGLCSQVYRRF